MLYLMTLWKKSEKALDSSREAAASKLPFSGLCPRSPTRGAASRCKCFAKVEVDGSGEVPVEVKRRVALSEAETVHRPT